jgi:hypothetical protein
VRQRGLGDAFELAEVLRRRFAPLGLVWQDPAP